MSGPRLRVGIVGTGEMGRPVIDRLLAAGFAVGAYARRLEVRAELAGLDVEVADSPAAVAAGRDVVLVYVFADEQVRAVVVDDGLGAAMEPGSVLVIHTTGSPTTARSIAQRLGAAEVGVVDAAGSGGPADVAEGRLDLFVGGDAVHVERCRPVFDAYASAVTHFGPVGAGQMVKLVNNLLFASHVQLALDAARLASAFGIDEAELARVLHTCSAQSYSLDLVAAMGSADEVVAASGPYVGKDVLVARAIAEEVGAPLGSITPVTDALLERTRLADGGSP